jgi:hypothetical protein
MSHGAPVVPLLRLPLLRAPHQRTTPSRSRHDETAELVQIGTTAKAGPATPPSRAGPSEIRLVRARGRGVLSVVFARVFGADEFRPLAHVAPIGDGGRPGHGEDAFVIDREMELQHRAPVIGVVDWMRRQLLVTSGCSQKNCRRRIESPPCIPLSAIA